MTIKFIAVLPAVPGADLLHATRSSAEREISNARKAGLGDGSAVLEVLLAG